MTFQDAATRFEQSGAGTDDFKRLSKDAFALMKADSANAALYFVVGSVAHAYAAKFEDQEVTIELAESAKSILVGFCKKIGQGLASDAATRLALLSEVVCEYQFDVQSF